MKVYTSIFFRDNNNNINIPNNSTSWTTPGISGYNIGIYRVIYIPVIRPNIKLPVLLLTDLQLRETTLGTNKWLPDYWEKSEWDLLQKI